MLSKENKIKKNIDFEMVLLGIEDPTINSLIGPHTSFFCQVGGPH